MTRQSYVGLAISQAAQVISHLAWPVTQPGTHEAALEKALYDAEILCSNLRSAIKATPTPVPGGKRSKKRKAHRK